MSTFRSVLALKDTPIVFGIVLAIATWMANRLVEAHTSSPLLEFSQNWLSSAEYQSKYVDRYSEVLTCTQPQLAVKNPAFILEVPIRNLSTNTKLDKIQLEFSYPPKTTQKMLGMRLRSKAPASAENESERCGPDFAVIKDLTFQPGTEYTLVLGLSEREEPFVTLTPSPTTVRVQRTNMVTRIIRFQSELILTFLVVMIGLAGRYLYLIARGETRKGGNQS